MSRHIITSYLKQYKNKSYYDFLLCYQTDIVATTSSTNSWEDLDNSWANNFLLESKNLDEDLNEKVCVFFILQG